jgi:drug/metabolite transporter (DMT)-like permease
MDRHQPSGRAALGLALATTTMLLWGVLPLALEAALTWVDPMTLTWFRFLAAAAVLAVFLARRGALPRVGRLVRPEWMLLAVATGGLAVNYLGYLVGLARTSPADAQVLIQLAPLLLGLGGIAVFRERYAGLQWLGFAVLVVGLAAFFASQLHALGRDLQRYRSGVTLLGVASFAWAGYGLAQKQLLRALPSQALMLCIYAGCALCFWPGSHPGRLGGIPAVGLAVLAFCAANTLVAYGAFAAALEHWEASRVSAVLALTPLATLACVRAAAGLAPDRFEGAHLPWASWVGAGLVVAGSLLTALGGPRIARPTARLAEPVAAAPPASGS